MQTRTNLYKSVAEVPRTVQDYTPTRGLSCQQM